MTIHLRRLENVYLQYREGLVDESALRNYGFRQIEMFRRPDFERYWVVTGWRAGFDAEFAGFLDSLRDPAHEGAQMTEHHDSSHNLALFIGVGVVLGAGVGAAIGTAIGNVPMVVAVGPAVGIAVAIAIWSARQSDD